MSITEETREGFYLSEDGEWIPNGWLNLPLNQVVSDFIDYRGKTPTKTTSGIPLITAKVVKNGRIYPTQEYIADDDYDTWMRRGIPNEKDVILTTEAPLGEVAFIPEGKIALAQRIITLRGDEDKLDNGFLKYSLQSPLMQSRLVARESGSTVSGIKSSELKVTNILHPSGVKEQKSIADVLGSLDDKIELLREQNETLEALAQTLFKRWFIDFNFPDENGNPYKDSGGKMIPSELGEIPEGWNVSNISECSEHIKISVKPDKHPTLTYNHYSLPAFDNGMLPVNEHGSEIKSNKYEVLPNSILVSKLNPGTPRIWQIQLVPENSICSTEFQVVKPRGETFSYVYSAVKTPAYTRELSGRAGGTSSSHQRVSPTDIFDIPLAMSENLEFEEQFSLIMGVSLEKIDHNRSKIQNLTNLRDTLLPKLMKGDIRVPVDV